MGHATQQDCPCCDARGGRMLDADMVAGFLAGVMAAEQREKIEDVLCEKLAFVAHASGAV